MDFVLPSLERSAGIKNGNLLPDLVAQIGGEILDVVDGIYDDRVVQMLRVKRGELVGQRQHFAAVVEIAGELEPAHRAFGGGGGGRAAAQERARVFGELMHVDDMCDRAETVQIAERALALHPGLERHQEEQYRAGEDDDVHRRLDALKHAENLDRS